MESGLDAGEAREMAKIIIHDKYNVWISPERKPREPSPQPEPFLDFLLNHQPSWEEANRM